MTTKSPFTAAPAGFDVAAMIKIVNSPPEATLATKDASMVDLERKFEASVAELQVIKATGNTHATKAKEVRLGCIEGAAAIALACMRHTGDTYTPSPAPPTHTWAG